MKPLNLLSLIATTVPLMTAISAQDLDQVFKAELYTDKKCSGKNVLTLDYGEEGGLPNLIQNPKETSLYPDSTFSWSTQRLKISKIPESCTLDLYDNNRHKVGGDYTETGKCISIPRSNIMEFSVSCPDA